MPRRMLDALRWQPGDPVLVTLTERGTVEISREVIDPRARVTLQPMMLDTTIPAALR